MSDQTERTPRLIWVFAGRTYHFVGFVMQRLTYLFLHDIITCSINCLMFVTGEYTAPAGGKILIQEVDGKLWPVFFFFFCIPYHIIGTFSGNFTTAGRIYVTHSYRNEPKFSDGYAWANSADPDQTAPRGAVWSGSTLFAIPSASFGLITLW